MAGNSLPKLFAGRRRGLMALLIGTGLAMAVLAWASALLMTRLLDGAAAAGAGSGPVVAGLAAAALGGGALRALERVLAEKLGQDYIHGIRKGLVESALATDRGPSPGVTIARSTNDLSSVRNWIALGIAPLAVGIPMILGTAVALWFLAPALSAAVVVPLAVLTGGLALLARPAFHRARTLRQQRGRLAARLADTVIAAGTIRAAGGEAREVSQVDKAGRKVVDAAVHRAAIAGWIRGSAAAGAALGSAAVAAVGVWQAVPTPTIAAGLTIVGMIAAPVADLGRVVEYRQNFKAARRILAPALAVAADAREGRRRRNPGVIPQGPGAAAGTEGGNMPGSLLVTGLSECRNCAVPELRAGPGDRIRIVSADPAAETRVLEKLIGVRSDPDACTLIDGKSLLDSGGRTRRALLGYAAAGTHLERGSIARSVRYRMPDLDPAAGTSALERMGLAERIARLPRGEQTQLKRGGEPLSTSERARLLLARATLGDPPLLVLNRIDADLDHAGTAVLARLVRDYPGVVLFASDHPGSVAGEYTEWNIDCPHAGLDLVWASYRWNGP
ncbi:ABC transporter transmembrane domain-containing protein [Arthrobacter mangrovi]|uniref:ABC-type multidrug/protein/lipid transport system, ATPase n=1 Tax=Arthrobacter mangrovi TaxID=2966350 RepID=A0ABQ5MP32_9MICC|nr:ABC transporter ATP-binding protein [Arthrobacter mangrovi]GLB65751.1 ABC-type multidrug/protein/lipid transport system, ATPase [Arthrobacter mangrovi]